MKAKSLISYYKPHYIIPTVLLYCTCSMLTSLSLWHETSVIFRSHLETKGFYFVLLPLKTSQKRIVAIIVSSLFVSQIIGIL